MESRRFFDAVAARLHYFTNAGVAVSALALLWSLAALARADEAARAEHTYEYARWVLCRWVAGIQFAALSSFAVQSEGLVGSAGLIPLPDTLAHLRGWVAARKQRGDSIPLPTRIVLAVWGDGSDARLRLLLLVGRASAAFGCFSHLLLPPGLEAVLLPVSYAVTYVTYLCIKRASGAFLNLQWDSLLLEVGLLMVPLSVPAADALSSRLGMFTVQLLAFRLLLAAGVVKLRSGDVSWRALTAMTYHYHTQPLPNPLSRFMHGLPVWVHKLETLATLVVELPLPLLFFCQWPSPWVHPASQAVLQAMITMTGNYGFFNTLAAVLMLSFVPDASWPAYDPPALPLLSAASPSAGLWAAWAASVALTYWAALLRLALGQAPGAWPIPAPAQALSEALSSWYVGGHYGLFASMTKFRDEVVVEGSADGKTWREIPFRWKPGDVAQRPRQVDWLHMPRLDWRLWFIPLAPRRRPAFFDMLLQRLLEGSPPVLALLAPPAQQPFPDPAQPPRFVRALLYSYRYAPPESGVWSSVIAALRNDGPSDRILLCSAIVAGSFPVLRVARYANHKRLAARRKARGGTAKELAKKAKEEAEQKEREERQKKLDEKYAEEDKKEEGEGKEDGEEKKDEKDEKDDDSEEKKDEDQTKTDKPKKPKPSVVQLLRRLYSLQPGKAQALSVTGVALSLARDVMGGRQALAKAELLKSACQTDAVTRDLLKQLGVILATSAGLQLFGSGISLLLRKASTVTQASIKEVVYDNILKQDVEYQEEQGTDGLRRMLEQDTNTLADFFTRKVPTVVDAASQSASAVVMLARSSPHALVVAAGSTCALMEWLHFMQRMIRWAGEEDDDDEKKNPSSEVLSNLRATRSFNREKLEQARYSTYLRGATVLSAGAVLQRCMYPIMWLAFELRAEASPVYLGDLVRRALVETTDVQLLQGWMSSITWKLWWLSWELDSSGEWVKSAERVFALLDREPVIKLEEGYVPEEGILGDIEFEGVKFSYPSTPDEVALDDATLSVAAGQTIGLVGPSGCGKTTTLALLQRFYDPQEGTVKIDGRDVKEYKPSFLYQQLGVVSQTPAVFETTVEENIRFGKPDATFEEVVEAARAANLHDDLMRKADGYGMMANELSGGQKQRVAIARAILKNPRILLLDEATSALDTKSERIVQQALERLMTGRTCIAIAHRLSTIVNADKIIVMNAGKVAEEGSHKALVAKGGQYAELVSQQLAVDKDEANVEVADHPPIEVTEGIAQLEAALAKGDNPQMEQALAALKAAQATLQAEKRRLALLEQTFHRQKSDLFNPSPDEPDRMPAKRHEELRLKARGAMHGIRAVRRLMHLGALHSSKAHAPAPAPAAASAEGSAAGSGAASEEAKANEHAPEHAQTQQ